LVHRHVSTDHVIARFQRFSNPEYSYGKHCIAI
jgi:hypothetical protein